ncbi:hypothetical protein ACH0B5_10455 [Ureibacillus sp. 179-F W5.1 NHS]|uniref:Uncharacterized protein n=1 Tax=Lysinibacillus halotolerans TaxID=1368476 RepID=A0A3M8HDR2_9BACI|nr:hypothetical protein [Lysinibacillus halotolerans]RND00608.1 hypothetical protein EC501_03970 [Lysinibacillus halotolerans]
MRNLYKIEKCQYLHNDLHFSLNESLNRIQIEPAGQVLADSDNLAFIYLVEEGDGYSYVQIPQKFWSELVQLVKLNRDPYLMVKDEKIKLTNFTEELHSLLFNIEGNDNYGNEFVGTVEKIFKEILIGE